MPEDSALTPDDGLPDGRPAPPDAMLDDRLPRPFDGMPENRVPVPFEGMPKEGPTWLVDGTPAFGVPTAFERTSGDFLISTDPARLDMDAVAAMLAGSYWAATRTRPVLERSFANSLCFGIYRIGASKAAHSQSCGFETADGRPPQVGVGRVVTDYAAFAWLCDVYIAEEFRGHGLGKWLVETVLAHPELQGLRRWMLATADAHGLYRQFGFQDISSPERWMERFSP